jgi:protein-tyrosine phosphatase
LLCVAQEINVQDDTRVQYKVPIIDMQPIPARQLKEAVEWVRDNIALQTIPVYCNAGVGRSSSVVIAYLCIMLNFGFGEAVEFVATRRPYMSILPNLLPSIKQARRLL